MSQQSPEENPPAQKPNGGFAEIAQEMAAKSALTRKENGHIDLLAAAGGVRGIAESVLPGLVFLVAFTITRDLTIALVGSVAMAAIFLVARHCPRSWP